MRFHLLRPLLLPVFAFATCHASENSLSRIFQPLDPMVDRTVVIREVPFVTSGPYPEVFFDAITRPHMPQQSTPSPVEDINVASRAGISLSCESAADGQKKLYIIWDFSKADPKQVDEALIDALIECLKRTAGNSIGLYSKFAGIEKLPAIKARILASIPEQTDEQRKADNQTR